MLRWKDWEGRGGGSFLRPLGDVSVLGSHICIKHILPANPVRAIKQARKWKPAGENLPPLL